MKKNEPYRYILFPLSLLQEIFKKPKTGFSDIFDYGIYKTASTQETTLDNAVKQSLYCFYRGGLTDSLKKKFDYMVYNNVFSPDEDYNGFNANEFYPEDEIQSITQHLHENQSLSDEIIEFHKLRQIKGVLNIKFSIEGIAETYKRLNKEYNDFKRCPLVMISKEMMFDYYLNQKSEYEKVLFATYAGIRSIIGNKQFCQTTRNMIFTRMVGAKNNEALVEILKDKKVNGIYGKYTKRYHEEKIINELRAKGYIKSKIAIKRRTYISCSLDLDELAEEIKRLFDENIKCIIKRDKINELNAKKKILQHLNK